MFFHGVPLRLSCQLKFGVQKSMAYRTNFISWQQAFLKGFHSFGEIRVKTWMQTTRNWMQTAMSSLHFVLFFIAFAFLFIAPCSQCMASSLLLCNQLQYVHCNLHPTRCFHCVLHLLIFSSLQSASSMNALCTSSLQFWKRFAGCLFIALCILQFWLHFACSSLRFASMMFCKFMITSFKSNELCKI